MARQRARVSLTATDLATLFNCLSAAAQNSVVFPPDSERHQRLLRWTERLEKRLPEDAPKDLRLNGGDYDVLREAVGLKLQELRGRSVQAFDTIAAQTRAGGGDAANELQRARDTLRELEQLEAINGRLAEAADDDVRRRAAVRRWILP